MRDRTLADHRVKPSRTGGLLVSALAPVFLAVLPAGAAAEPSFVNKSSDLPVQHRYEGDWEHFVGGGVAIFDCNGDRMPDLYAAGGSAPSHLFINETPAPGAGIAFSEGAIAALDGVTGAYPLDVDSDGYIDLMVLRAGPNILLKGDGACGFTPAPEDWGFDGGDEWTTAFSATFEKGEEWPTLAIGNYVDRKNPDGPFEACDTNYLVRPEGRSFGARQALEPGWCALSMLISDWKRNGTPDLRISNDRQYYVHAGKEQMWRLSPLAEYTEADGWPEMKLWGMGIASNDLDGDGLPEVFLTSMADQVLLLNRGGGTMEMAPYSMGATATTPFIGDDGRSSTGWHAQFGDIDNDGRDDIFIAKGNVEQMPSNAIHDPNNLLMQKADGTFAEKADVAGIATTDRSRGAGLADLNLDGRLDIVVVNRRAPLEIWQNTTSDTGHFLAVEPRLKGVNSRAVGGFIEVKTPDGRVQTREITIGGGHVSGQALSYHFGLGNATEAELRLTWPSGEQTGWVSVSANTMLFAAQGETPTDLVLEPLLR